MHQLSGFRRGGSGIGIQNEQFRLSHQCYGGFGETHQGGSGAAHQRRISGASVEREAFRIATWSISIMIVANNFVVGSGGSAGSGSGSGIVTNNYRY